MAIYRKEDMIEYYQSKGYTFEKKLTDKVCHKMIYYTKPNVHAT